MNGELVPLGDLKARLNMIIQTVPQFWDQKPYNHFTNHGPAHSERIHSQKLAQLAQALPESHRLSNDEIFIVSAAAWLYEIGMQSPYLKPVLDFDYEPGEQLSFLQLKKIRESKHLLSKNLIMEDYQGNPLQLGLTRPTDDYTQLIADVCYWCSSDPLESVPETLPVGGMPVRLRLLVALLRLSDQLYIDISRVNIDLLQRANLPTEQLAKWWIYQYVQTLPIENGKIPFDYFLPATQKEYLERIRTLVEPSFAYDNNPIIRYLWDEYELHLRPHKIPTVRLDQPGGFRREMRDELTNYFRQKVKISLLKDEGTPHLQEDLEDRCLLVLDYENFILQLGLEGYFLASKDDISRLSVKLLTEASNQYIVPVEVDALAVGHWDRPDLIDIGKMLEAHFYKLVTIEHHDNSSEKLTQVLTKHLQSRDAPKYITLVSPHLDLASTVRELKKHKLPINAWITNTFDPYRAVIPKYKLLPNLLRLGKANKVTSAEIENSQTACILRLDDEMINSKNGDSLNKIRSLLNQVHQITGQVDWWQLWLFNQKIIILHSSSEQALFQLNSEHAEVVKVRDMRQTVIEALQTLSQDDEGVPQNLLVKELTRRITHFQSKEIASSFLELLKDEEIVRRDARSQLPEALWYLNSSHPLLIRLNTDRYLPQLVLALDQILVREGYRSLYEHTLMRHLSPYMENTVAEIVYKLALAEEWIYRRDSNQQHSHRRDKLPNVSLANKHVQVGETMRNRNILLNILYHKSARNGLRRNELWAKLRKIRSFTLNEVELKQWLNILEKDSIINIKVDEGDGRVVIKLELDTPLTQRLLGRMNIYGLVRNLRIMGAIRPEKKKPVREVLEKLTKFVVQNKAQLAVWTLNYAEVIRLVRIENDFVYLMQHSVVRQLDRRERSTCRNLADFVQGFARPNSGGWVPRYVVLQEMEKEIKKFGYARGEHEYWLDQAIFRCRMLERKRERGRGRLQEFVRVPPKK